VQVAAHKLVNGSHICASPQVLVVDRDWPQRQAFLDALRRVFRSANPERCFYPGAKERYEHLKSSYPQAEVCATKVVPEGCLPLVLITDIAPDSVLTREEAFAPLLAEVLIDTKNDPAAFLKQAVAYANDKLFGSLSGTILIDPRTEAAHKEALDNAIRDMRYGAIGVNTAAGLMGGLPPMTWGAFAGAHPDTDIQSGTGKVNNSFMIDRPQKAVLRSPFVHPGHWRPADRSWMLSGYRLAYFSVRQTPWRFFKLLSAALTGY